jgi:multifunctional beta-oxidation protein
VVAHDNDDIPLVADAKKLKSEPLDYSYTERDVILYNLSIGATEKELKWSYESDDDFAVLPTYGVIPQFPASGSLSYDFLPNYNPAKLLHGEQYLAIKGPIPTSGDLVNEAKIIEVLDKGKAASVTTVVETKDKATGKVIFENQMTVFIRGSGGFGGKREGKGMYTYICVLNLNMCEERKNCTYNGYRPWCCLRDERRT